MTPRAFSLAAALLFISCSQSAVDLRDATADQILKEVSAHRGNEAVLVNFWATWCVPCVEEFPMIVELAEQYRDKAVKVYFVSVDWLNERQRAIDFLERHGVQGVSFIKNQDDNEFIDGISRQWSGAVPFTIVFGKESGKVVDLWEAKKQKQRFEQSIERALNEGESS
ncbi:MAG: TlpA disulfide reductase family protein [Candidatus Marinimicrobia bacterium]|nr:TlpA disulfide reductase family protein [Candidatus Neomarinimicrobiota bacterium]MDP6836630.1 TlpA disulfide reductase family protein [Candidatus Neomarinimicrobiota bacterium]